LLQELKLPRPQGAALQEAQKQVTGGVAACLAAKYLAAWFAGWLLGC
jgi:hypothetical protein